MQKCNLEKCNKKKKKWNKKKNWISEGPIHLPHDKMCENNLLTYTEEETQVTLNKLFLQIWGWPCKQPPSNHTKFLSNRPADNHHYLMKYFFQLDLLCITTINVF